MKKKSNTKPRSHEVVTGKPVRVQRKRTKGYRLPANTVSVTRPGKWGNPFKSGEWMGVNAGGNDAIARRTPEQAVAAFKKWLSESSIGQALARAAKVELRGKNLACYCALDKICHADVLLEIANGDEPIGGGARRATSTYC